MVEKAVEAGLVGGVREGGIDGGDGLACGKVEAAEVLGDVTALRLVGEEMAEVAGGLREHMGEGKDASHGEDLS